MRRKLGSICAASTSWSNDWNQPNDGVSRQIQKNSTLRRAPSFPLFCLYQMCFRILAKDEAPYSVGVQTNHEEKGEMVGIPKGLKALLADFVVGGAVHENHYEEHDMSSYSCRLPVVNVERNFWTELASLDVDKVDIMGCGVDHSPEGQ